VLLAAASVARAEPDPAAAKLFDEGREAAKAGNYSEACAKFTRSFELDPATGTEVNLADCIEHQGFIARAWKLWDDAANRSEHDFPARSKLARERADKIVPKLATIVLEVAQPAPDVVLTIAGKPVPTAAEVRERVEPGQLDISATEPGKPRFVRTVQAAAGVTLTIDVPAFGVAVATVEPPPIPRRQRTRVYLAAGVGVVGVVGLVVASVVGLGARSMYQDQLASGACHETPGGLTCSTAGAAQVDSAGQGADTATVLFISGAVLVALGATLYFTAPREQVITVTPMATTAGIGLQLGTRF
jgi:hypothetical protein